MSNSLSASAMGQKQPLSLRFEEAFVFAAQKHQYQTRKGTTIPYIVHLMQVSGIALENGANEDEAIAALPHNVIEDQDVTEEELTRQFGPEVAVIVAGCSDSASTDKAPWKQRKEAYIAHVLTTSALVRLVSSCDKLHNARAILADYQELGGALWSRFNASPGDILWYYGGLVHAFQQAQEQQGEPPSRVVAQLDRVVTELAGLVPNPDAKHKAGLAWSYRNKQAKKEQARQEAEFLLAGSFALSNCNRDVLNYNSFDHDVFDQNVLVEGLDTGVFPRPRGATF